MYQAIAKLICALYFESHHFSWTFQKGGYIIYTLALLTSIHNGFVTSGNNNNNKKKTSIILGYSIGH